MEDIEKFFVKLKPQSKYLINVTPRLFVCIASSISPPANNLSTSPPLFHSNLFSNTAASEIAAISKHLKRTYGNQVLVINFISPLLTKFVDNDLMILDVDYEPFSLPTLIPICQSIFSWMSASEVTQPKRGIFS